MQNLNHWTTREAPQVIFLSGPSTPAQEGLQEAWDRFLYNVFFTTYFFYNSISVRLTVLFIFTSPVCAQGPAHSPPSEPVNFKKRLCAVSHGLGVVANPRCSLVVWPWTSVLTTPRWVSSSIKREYYKYNLPRTIHRFLNRLYITSNTKTVRVPSLGRTLVEHGLGGGKELGLKREKT